jgi:uncharacterized damage-inducible protein DinB
MDILDRMLEHDALSMRYQLGLCQLLSAEQLNQVFAFGQESIYKTLDHMIDSQEFWVWLMEGNTDSFPPPPADPNHSIERIIQRYEAVCLAFDAIARSVRDESLMDDTFVDLETGPARRSFGSCILHVTTHNMHHRAQVFVMFDLLGVSYNPFAGSAIDGYPLD